MSMVEHRLEKNMSKNRQVVLTEGPILKALIALALPIMATSFLNTFYSITDMAWIGMLGSRAVAVWAVCTCGCRRDCLLWRKWEDR